MVVFNMRLLTACHRITVENAASQSLDLIGHRELRSSVGQNDRHNFIEKITQPFFDLFYSQVHCHGCFFGMVDANHQTVVYKLEGLYVRSVGNVVVTRIHFHNCQLRMILSERLIVRVGSSLQVSHIFADFQPGSLLVFSLRLYRQIHVMKAGCGEDALFNVGIERPFGLADLRMRLFDCVDGQASAYSVFQNVPEHFSLRGIQVNAFAGILEGVQIAFLGRCSVIEFLAQTAVIVSVASIADSYCPVPALAGDSLLIFADGITEAVMAALINSLAVISTGFPHIGPGIFFPVGMGFDLLADRGSRLAKSVGNAFSGGSIRQTGFDNHAVFL